MANRLAQLDTNRLAGLDESTNRLASLDQQEIGAWQPSLWERLKFAVYKPPPAGGYDRSDRPFRTLGKAALYGVGEYATGRALYTPELITEEPAEVISGFEPTPKEKQIGETLKFIGGLRTASQILAPIITTLPTVSGQAILGATGIFGLRNISEQVVNWLRTGEKPSLIEFEKEAVLGTLFGVGELGLIKFIGFARGLGKLRKSQLRPARAEVDAAIKHLNKTGDRTAWDAVRIKYAGITPEGAARIKARAAPPEVKEFGKFPLARPIEAPRVPVRPPVRPAKPITPTKPTPTPKKGKYWGQPKLEADYTPREYVKVTGNIVVMDKTGKAISTKKQTFWAYPSDVKEGRYVFQEVDKEGSKKSAITILDKEDVIKIEPALVSKRYGELEVIEAKPTPTAPKVRKGFLYVKPLKTAHDTFLKIVEPAKLAEKAVGKGVVAKVIRAIHAPEAKRLEFRAQQLESADKTFGQIRDDFSKYPDDVLEKVMLTRGHGLEGDARHLQRQAFATLPKELKKSSVRRALDEIADFNYKYLQKVVGDDVNKMRDYFYGIYKSPKLIRRFLKYWKTTKRFIKHKKFPTYADAKAYGLEIRNPNPVDNLMTEYTAIAHLDAMGKLKSELMRTGEGKYIAETKNAPLEWQPIGEGLPIEPTFSDVRVQPDLARLINNLIATNKITQIPTLNTIRQINNFLRTVKFIGSAFHLMSVAKQSVADSGYLGFYKRTAVKGITTGFRKDDPIFRTPQYKDYILHGGGHRYSVESEAQRVFSSTIAKLTRHEQMILRAGGTPLKIPVTFVNWMFKNYIPKVKYSKFLDTVAEKERRLGRELASAEKIDIIKEQQNFYGMMNERLFGRSGTVTTLLRFVFMAPGYAEGNYRTILKAGLQKGAHRSRSNIINSWLITGMAATIGTMALTGKLPKKPEDLDDIRDLFKIHTGKFDKRGQEIMIDLMTYDKDYFNVYFNIARLRPDKALSLSVRRIGGMRAPSADLVIDLLKLWRGEALIDWKGDDVYYLTDPFLLKVVKAAKLEFERLVPISASVYKQSRQREIDRVTAATEMLLGLRPTRTEKDKREFEVVRDIWSLRDQREKLSYRLNKYDDPMGAVRKYNRTVNTIRDAKFVQERAPDLIKKLEKLLIDEEKVKTWKRFPISKMNTAEIRKALRAHTYKADQKARPFGYNRWRPHKGWEERVGAYRKELKKR